MLGRFLRITDAVYLFCIWVSGLALVVMTVVIPMGIVTRLFSSFTAESNPIAYPLARLWQNTLGAAGTSWQEPIAILCMIIFTFLGAAASYRASGHIAVTMLVDRVPQTVQKIFSFFVQVLLAVLSVFVLIKGGQLCSELWTQPVAEFPAITAGQTYLPLPLGALITLLFIAETFICGSQAQRPLVTIGNPGSEEHNLGEES